MAFVFETDVIEGLNRADKPQLARRKQCTLYCMDTSINQTENLTTCLKLTRKPLHVLSACAEEAHRHGREPCEQAHLKRELQSKILLPSA